MSLPRPETIEREKDKLFLTAAELYRRIGLDRRVAKPAVQQLMDKAGFPKPNKLFGGTWYWPAVKAWLDKHYGLNPQERSGAR